MLLASVQGIREALGFDDMTDINAAIEMALHAAEPQLAALLDTSFERGDVTDVFWVQRPGFSQMEHVRTEFRLSRGLLASAPSVTATERVSLVNPSASIDLSADMKFDLEKGVARDWSTVFNRQYVTFSYTAGFEPDADNAESYKLDQVPRWLQEAAKLKCLLHMASSPSVTEAGIDLDKKVLEAQYTALINKHIRYAPTALLPL
ncbi:MAG: hypothetical protein KJZ83_00360 [Burkholderiaceae bacterium]|nr:hypothetical protein [Burkholderiaceae bacterium]